MQRIKIFQVDAFTNALFSGNPAAVCLTDQWLTDQTMQSIAMENNLSETAFVVPAGDAYEIRWFTPVTEVDLCGHATLASACILFNQQGYPGSVIRFRSPRSGALNVRKDGEMFYLDFPTDTLVSLSGEYTMIERGMGIQPIEVYKGKTDYLAVVANESEVRHLKPDFNEISKLDARGLIVTAKGDQVDFVSRFFAPQSGINEDPVTGSAHTSLLPYWVKKLGKNQLIARQLSARGGQLHCEFKNDRCLIGGEARLYLTGEIILD